MVSILTNPIESGSISGGMDKKYFLGTKSGSGHWSVGNKSQLSVGTNSSQHGFVAAIISSITGQTKNIRCIRTGRKPDDVRNTLETLITNTPRQCTSK